MKIELTFSPNDVQRVRDVVKQMADHPDVIRRQKRNVERQGISLSHSVIWKTHIGCLVTTQQKSGKGSAVDKFLESTSPLLSLNRCEAEKDLVKFAETELTIGKIWRAKVISKQIQSNMKLFKGGGWRDLESILSRLKEKPQPKKVERQCADQVAQALDGLGPKQSRNFLQWLGLTQYEIPIDSRITKWLKRLGKKDSLPLLSSAALGESEYYCCVMDKLQDLCQSAGVLPCIFDAAVFVSADRSEKM